MKQPTRKMRALGMVEHGAVSRLTHGLTVFLPWYELGVPPFIYACPYC